MCNEGYQICQNAKSRVKIKVFEFRTKLPYLDIARLKFEETIIIFEISTHGFFKMQSFAQVKKVQFWDQEFLSRQGFWAAVFKSCCHL